MSIETRISRIEERIGGGCGDCCDVGKAKPLTFADLAAVAVGRIHAECESCGRQFFVDDDWVRTLATAASGLFPMALNGAAFESL